MKIVTADITGSLIVNGVDVTSNVVSSSVFSGSIAGRVTSLEQFSASLDATFATDASVTASILVLSQSVQTSQAALSSSYTATSGSYVAVSGSYVITSGSYAAASASLSTRVTNTEATASTNTQASASFAAYSGSMSTRLTTDETNITTLTNASSSFAAQSASLSTRLTTDETNFTNLSSSFATTSGSIAGRVTIIEGQDATTGSNIFTGTQRITEASNAISFTSTASLYTDGGLRVSKDSFVSGTAYFNNVVVYGTSSIQYITSSQVNFGTNIITVNTDTPAVRFGGLAVFDSGSTQLTGSMLWDSEKNHWIYSNPSGSTYNSAMLMNGPRNTGSLGSEQGTTSCAMMIGQGGDHITSSMIYSYGNATCFYGQSYISGSGDACFAGTVCAPSFIGGTMSGTTIYGSTAVCSPVGKFTSCIDAGSGNFSDNVLISKANLLSSLTIKSSCSTTGLQLYLYGLNATLSNQDNGSLVFQTNGADRLTITSTGAATFACQVCAPSLGLTAGGTINNLANIQYGGYTWAAYNTSNGTITISNTSGCGINFATGEACFAGAINSPGGTISQDLRIYRSAGTTTGYINFGSTGTNYFGFDGTKYVANGSISATSFIGGTISGTTIYGSTAVCSPVGLFSGCVGVGISPQSILETFGASPIITITDSNTFSSGVARTSGIEFKAFNPSGNITTQSAGIYGVITPETGYTPNQGYLTFYTRLQGASYTEKMRITSAGNVGIGTCSPSGLLHLSNTDPRLFITNTQGGSSYYLTVSPTIGFNIFENGVASWFTIRNGGNVGIGISTPNETLDVNGTIQVRGSSVGYATTQCVTQLDFYAGAARILSFGGNATTCGCFRFYSAAQNNAGGSDVATISGGGVACFKGAVCAPNAVINCLGVNAVWDNSGGANQPLQVKSGVAGSGIWIESCSSDAGGYINMNGNCLTIGQSYRTSAGFNDILFQTAGNTRMTIRCTGIVDFSCNVCAPKTTTCGTVLFKSNIPTQGDFLSYQQNIGGCGLSAQAGGDYVHIKTNITKDDRMVGFNVRGYMYAPDPIDTDIAFYTYAPVDYVYSVSIYEKSYTGWNYCLYYSTDSKVVLVVQGSGTYGGFILTGINTARYNQMGEMCILGVAHATCWCAQF